MVEEVNGLVKSMFDKELNKAKEKVKQCEIDIEGCKNALVRYNEKLIALRCNVENLEKIKEKIEKNE